MKYSIFLAFLAFFSQIQIGSAETIASKLQMEGFCNRTADDIKQIALDPLHRILSANQGGLAFGSGGVCWWHSRMQRAAIYLTLFAPELPKPTEKEAADIFENLMNMRVTVIPGYSDFYHFSGNYRKILQKKLNSWQLSNGILQMKWIDGLAGKYSEDAADLRRRMEDIFQRVVKKREITFAKLQMKGIDAHAFLIVDAAKSKEGITLKVIDSNRPKMTFEVPYLFGQSHVAMPYNDQTFVPYVDYSNDLVRIQKSVRKYCPFF